MPVGARGTSAISTSASARGAAPETPWGAQRARLAGAGARAADPPPASDAGASVAVFHAPHDGQRPNQRDCSLPHDEQKK
jgi:hypothetical protein